MSTLPAYFRLAAVFVFSVVAACGGDSSDEADGGSAPGPMIASYVYLSADALVVEPDYHVVFAEATVNEGLVTPAPTFSVPMPPLEDRQSILGFDASGPRAVVAMLSVGAGGEVIQLRPDLSGWDTVPGPADAGADASCGGLRRPQSLDEDRFALLHMGIPMFTNPCGDGSNEDDFFVIRTYERGTGWTTSQPADLAATRDRLHALLWQPDGYSSGVLLDYDPDAGSMTYLLTTYDELAVVRMSTEDWSFELMDQYECESPELGLLGDGGYWRQCRNSPRYHCGVSECVPVDDGVPSYYQDQFVRQYDRLVGRRVGVSSWIENFVAHTRVQGAPELVECGPAVFPDPANADLVRLVSTAGEHVYNVATGATTPATEPLHDALFGSTCHYAGSLGPFFFTSPLP